MTSYILSGSVWGSKHESHYLIFAIRLWHVQRHWIHVTAKKTFHTRENIKWPMGTRAEDLWCWVCGLPITRHCYCTLFPDECVGFIHVRALRFQVRGKNSQGPMWWERTDHRGVKAIKQDHGSSDGTPTAPHSHSLGCTHAIGIQMPRGHEGDLCFIFVLDSSAQKLLCHFNCVWTSRLCPENIQCNVPSKNLITRRNWPIHYSKGVSMLKAVSKIIDDKIKEGRKEKSKNGKK